MAWRFFSNRLRAAARSAAAGAVAAGSAGPPRRIGKRRSRSVAASAPYRAQSGIFICVGWYQPGGRSRHCATTEVGLQCAAYGRTAEAGGQGDHDGMTPAIEPAYRRSTGLVDVLDRVLDKGLVVAGDIRVSLAEVELLTIRIRLLSARSTRPSRSGWTGGARIRTCRSPPGRLTLENETLREQVRLLEAEGGRVGSRTSEPERRQPPGLAQEEPGGKKCRSNELPVEPV